MNAEYTKLVVNGFGSFGTPRSMRTPGSTSYRNKMEATSRAFMQAYQSKLRQNCTLARTTMSVGIRRNTLILLNMLHFHLWKSMISSSNRTMPQFIDQRRHKNTLMQTESFHSTGHPALTH